MQRIVFKALKVFGNVGDLKRKGGINEQEKVFKFNVIVSIAVLKTLNK